MITSASRHWPSDINHIYQHTKVYHKCDLEEIYKNDRMYRKLFKPYPKQWLNAWGFYAHWYRNENGSAPASFRGPPSLYDSQINREAIRVLRKHAWESWANRKFHAYWKKKKIQERPGGVNEK